MKLAQQVSGQPPCWPVCFGLLALRHIIEELQRKSHKLVCFHSKPFLHQQVFLQLLYCVCFCVTCVSFLKCFFVRGLLCFLCESEFEWVHVRMLLYPGRPRHVTVTRKQLSVYCRFEKDLLHSPLPAGRERVRESEMREKKGYERKQEIEPLKERATKDREEWKRENQRESKENKGLEGENVRLTLLDHLRALQGHGHCALLHLSDSPNFQYSVDTHTLRNTHNSFASYYRLL